MAELTYVHCSARNVPITLEQDMMTIEYMNQIKIALRQWEKMLKT